jgi:diketogulonate reductase-like aldo/keto reductase
MYSAGASEQYLGNALKAAPREQLFVATKVVKGVDRHSILASLDRSLTRLRMSYIDLYLHPLARAGHEPDRNDGCPERGGSCWKTRLVGCCNFPAYLLASAQCRRSCPRLGAAALQPGRLQSDREHG